MYIWVYQLHGVQCGLILVWVGNSFQFSWLQVGGKTHMCNKLGFCQACES